MRARHDAGHAHADASDVACCRRTLVEAAISRRAWPPRDTSLLLLSVAARAMILQCWALKIPRLSPRRNRAIILFYKITLQ